MTGSGGKTLLTKPPSSLPSFFSVGLLHPAVVAEEGTESQEVLTEGASVMPDLGNGSHGQQERRMNEGRKGGKVARKK